MHFLPGGVDLRQIRADGNAVKTGELSGKEAVAAVLADPNNSYSKNELKAAALRLKKLFGE